MLIAVLTEHKKKKDVPVASSSNANANNDAKRKFLIEYLTKILKCL